MEVQVNGLQAKEDQISTKLDEKIILRIHPHYYHINFEFENHVLFEK